MQTHNHLMELMHIIDSQAAWILDVDTITHFKGTVHTKIQNPYFSTGL